MQGRMLGYNQRAHTNKHNQGWDDNAVLIWGQQFLLIGKLVNQSISNKDGIVVTLSEDKGCQNHIDNIELHVEHTHNTQDPYPAQCHREECQQTEFQSAEWYPQEKEHNESTGKTDIVEVIGEWIGNGTVHPDEIEGITIFS